MAGQLLVMEALVPDFIPSRRLVQRAVVWPCLPGLSLEYWVPMAITEKAGILLFIDYFTNMLRKMGYARVRAKIDAGKSICPEILIKEKEVLVAVCI